MPKSRKNTRKGRNTSSKKYRNIRNNRKTINDISELGTLLNEDKNAHNLDHVLKIFRNRKLFGLFSGVKSRGIGVIHIFFTLIILKFLRIKTVNGIYTSEFKEVEACKDVFYDFKNNENIPWRKVLLETAKIYKRTVSKEKVSIDKDGFIKKGIKTLDLDDSDISKTGLKIEGVGTIWSHVENRSIIGYKIMVLCFWDGKCLIPIDFSLHREKGNKIKNASKQVNTKDKEYQQVKSSTQKYKKNVADYQKAKTTAEKQWEALKEAKKKCKGDEKKQTDEKIKDACQLLEITKESLKQCISRLNKSESELERKETALQKAQEKLKKIEKSDFKYGLSKEQRSAQFSKKRDKSSAGAKRYAELNSKKNKNAEKMIRRAVYHGFVPDYVLADSWFFSHSMIETVRSLDNGSIHYLGMAKIGNILYDFDTKQYNASQLLKKHKKNAHSCRKLKARYITVAVKYHDIDLNLMFVRLNGTKQWRLLATTDTKLTFIKAIEIYQIRWSIEVFFKDTKQHLGLGKCQSNDFDAQIADNTIVMMRYIMLSLHKRIHYQQPIGGLFKELSDQMVEANIAQKLWFQFIELQLYIAEKLNIDFETFYKQIKSDKKCNTKLKGVIEIFDWFYKDIRESVDVPDEDENIGLAA